MLLVNAKKGPSQVHGLGLIAQEFIPKGTAIWRFMPGFDVSIPEAEIDKLSPTSREQVLYYAYLDRTTRMFILSSDDDRFTNHSDRPNTWSRDHLTVAIEDIKPGEEITASYVELNVISFLTEPQVAHNGHHHAAADGGTDLMEHTSPSRVGAVGEELTVDYYPLIWDEKFGSEK